MRSKVDEAKRELRRHTDAVGRADGDPDVLAKLLSEAKHDLALHEATVLDDAEIERALVEFDDVWSKLSPTEKVRVIETLIERVDFDGAAGKVAIEFRPTGIKSLEVAQ